MADAQARGLEVLLTFYFAPNYAEGENKPGNAPAGTWKPKPGAVEDFAFALASRYPTVDYIQAWNEPTLDVYLTPQYQGKKAKSPGVYKDLLNAAYEGVKDAGDAQVVTAGAAPYGEPPGGDRMRPIAFWRKVFCLKGRQQLEPGNCGAEPKLDVFAHHPINTSGGPHRSALHPDDASTPDLKNVVRVLRKAEQHEQRRRRPPSRVGDRAVVGERSARPFRGRAAEPSTPAGSQEALYLLWKQGARVVINLQIRDAQFDSDNPFGEDVTGIFRFSGQRKPAFAAWRFPFVAHGGKSVRAWGKAPATGEMLIERKAKRRVGHREARRRRGRGGLQPEAQREGEAQATRRGGGHREPSHRGGQVIRAQSGYRCQQSRRGCVVQAKPRSSKREFLG